MGSRHIASAEMFLTGNARAALSTALGGGRPVRAGVVDGGEPLDCKVAHDRSDEVYWRYHEPF